MKNPFEYWKGRKGLEMWAVLEEDTVEVKFPFFTDQAERLQSRRDYVGVVHHLTRNEGCYMVSVIANDREVVAECKTLEEAAARARVLAVPMQVAV